MAYPVAYPSCRLSLSYEYAADVILLYEIHLAPIIVSLFHLTLQDPFYPVDILKSLVTPLIAKHPSCNGRYYQHL